MTTAIPAKDERAGTAEPSYEALARIHEGPCISLYTKRRSGAGRAGSDRRRFQEALRSAEASFQGASRTFGEAERLLESNWQLIEETEHAHTRMPGTAIFLSRDFFGYCPLPVPLAERVVVGNGFLIRPLLALIPTNDRFFVLALSQKYVRLFEGSRRGMKELHLQDAPENLHEDLAGLSFERRYEMHTAASPASNQKGAIFHGPSVTNKDRLIHYFRDVDRGVAGTLSGQQAPLIVAAVEYLFPIYREANTYAHLWENAITGNPDLLSPEALHEASWKIFERHLSDAAAHAFGVYKEHVNTPLTSSNLRKIIAAADRGSVRFLFVPPTGEQWGWFEPPETVHVHSVREPGDNELLNLAVILTLRHGGQVFPVPANELREGAEAAAVFRF
jgi:Bacterial archaeo-eukaryotic release factor family 7